MQKQLLLFPVSPASPAGNPAGNLPLLLGTDLLQLHRQFRSVDQLEVCSVLWSAIKLSVLASPTEACTAFL